MLRYIRESINMHIFRALRKLSICAWTASLLYHWTHGVSDNMHIQ